MPAKIALLKGRANYVCLHHLEESSAGGTFASREEATRHPRHRALRRADGSPATRPNACEVPEFSGAWARATSTRENCLGSKCRHYEDCFVMKARKSAPTTPTSSS